MANRCSICALGADLRHAIDRELITGGTFRDVAARYDVSKSALVRHLQSDVAPEIRAALTEGQSVDTADLLLRVVQIADDAQSIREQLTENAQPLDALKAGDSELRALALIVSRIGITDSDVLEAIKQASEIGVALAAVVKVRPELSELLVSELRERGSYEVANAYQTVTERFSKKEVTAA